MSLSADWWDRIARMSRPSLVQTLVEEAQLRQRRDEELERTRADYNDLNNKVTRLEKDVSDLQLEYEGRILIAATMEEASRAARDMGLTGKRTLVLTSHQQADHSLRGLRLRLHQVVLVPGWQRGRFASYVKDSLHMCGVDYRRCVYAPSWEIERMESTGYGRGYGAPPQTTFQSSYYARDPYYPTDEIKYYTINAKPSFAFTDDVIPGPLKTTWLDELIDPDKYK